MQACVDDGYTRREADPADARRTLVALTDGGRAIVDRARAQRVGAVERALTDFSAEEREHLAALLTRLAEHWPA